MKPAVYPGFHQPVFPLKRKLVRENQCCHLGPLSRKSKYPYVDRSLLIASLLDVSMLPKTPLNAQVGQALHSLYTTSNSAISLGRCAHELGRRATGTLQESRSTVANYLNASESTEIVFAPCVTSAMHTVALAFARSLQPRDEILIAFNTPDETIQHWRYVAERHKLVVRLIQSDISEGSLPDISSFVQCVGSRTRAIVLPLYCSVTGARMPLEEVTPFFNGIGAPSILDMTISPAHSTEHLDVEALNCDIVVINATAYLSAPGGAVIYGQSATLERLPPTSGGEYSLVDFTQSTSSLDLALMPDNWTPVPERFESGTSYLTTAVTIAASIQARRDLGQDEQANSSQMDLGLHLQNKLANCDRVTLYTCADGMSDTSTMATFNIDDCQAAEVARHLARRDICVSAGTHGAAIAHGLGFEVDSSIRVVFDENYHSEKDVDKLIEGLKDFISNTSGTTATAATSVQ